MNKIIDNIILFLLLKKSIKLQKLDVFFKFNNCQGNAGNKKLKMILLIITFTRKH